MSAPPSPGQDPAARALLANDPDQLGRGDPGGRDRVGHRGDPVAWGPPVFPHLHLGNGPIDWGGEVGTGQALMLRQYPFTASWLLLVVMATVIVWAVWA